MKKLFKALVMLTIICAPAYASGNLVAEKTQRYFSDIFLKMKLVADGNPTPENFRSLMQSAVKDINGVFGGSLIDENWVIRQVLFPSHFLARGFDLKNVKELSYFREQMKKSPGPQVSEPAHGNIFQPGLISVRYPVIRDGRVTAIVSMFVRTDIFLEAIGLDKAKAYEIRCRGVVCEKRGVVSSSATQTSFPLPSTEWEIRYES